MAASNKPDEGQNQSSAIDFVTRWGLILLAVLAVSFRRASRYDRVRH